MGRGRWGEMGKRVREGRGREDRCYRGMGRKKRLGEKKGGRWQSGGE